MEVVHIFLSSPGDVVEERQLALDVIERIQAERGYRSRVKIEVVSWDKPGVAPAMLAHMDPQEAINLGMLKPSQCDMAVVIFGARIGTPLSDKYQKADGRPYRSGTEYEFIDALTAAQERGRPETLVYRKTSPPLVSLGDPQRREKEEQWDLLQEFFSEFKKSDGSYVRSFNKYGQPSEFKDLLDHHIRDYLTRHLQSEGNPGKKQHVQNLSPFLPTPCVSLSTREPVTHRLVDINRHLLGRIAEHRRKDVDVQTVSPLRILVLGDTGTGKTTLAMKLHESLMRKRGVRAIYLDLSAADLENIPNTNLPGISGVGTVSLRTAMESCASDNLHMVLILDSLDKMTPGATFREIAANLRKLNAASHGAATIILLTRTHLFRSSIEEDMLAGYEKLYVAPLSLRKARTIFEAKDKGFLYQKLVRFPDVSDLLKRPLNCTILLKTELDVSSLADVHNQEEMVAQCINGWLSRDLPNSVLSSERKRHLITLIALRTFNQKGKMISPEDIDRFLLDVENGISRSELSSFNSDLRTCSFLRRNEESDRYEFMHDVFCGFFVSTEVLRRIESGDLTLLANFYMDEGMVEFMRAGLCSRPTVDVLLTQLEAGWYREVDGQVLGNILTLMAALGGRISELQFAGRSFNSLFLWDQDLGGVVLTDATFRDADFVGCRFHSSRSAGASFVDCTFVDTALQQLNLTDFAFRDCRFAGTTKIDSLDFNACDILHTHFDCELANTSFSASRMTDVLLSCNSRVTFFGCELRKVWLDQNYDHSKTRYTANKLDSSSKVAIEILAPQKRPSVDFKVGEMTDDFEAIDRRAARPDIADEKPLAYFVSGMSKTKEKKFMRQRAKMLSLRDRGKQ